MSIADGGGGGGAKAPNLADVIILICRQPLTCVSHPGFADLSGGGRRHCERSFQQIWAVNSPARTFGRIHFR